MWFIGVEVEQETSAPPPKKNPGSALHQNMKRMNPPYNKNAKKEFNEKYNAILTSNTQSSDVCFRCLKQGH